MVLGEVQRDICFYPLWNLNNFEVKLAFSKIKCNNELLQISNNNFKIIRKHLTQVFIFGVQGIFTAHF